MNDVEGMLTLLAVEPTLMPSAAAHAGGDYMEHRQRDERAYIVVSKKKPETGPRWLDPCLDCDHWLLTKLPEEWKL
ncbi:hypothetical protein ACWDRB_62950 [Nonomuraea sp. NPDC003707]